MVYQDERHARQSNITTIINEYRATLPFNPIKNNYKFKLKFPLNKRQAFHIDNLKSLEKWRSSSLSELTPIIFHMGLTHLGLDILKKFSLK